MGKAFEAGYYIEPAVFTNVDPAMRIAQEEIFGLVVCVIPFDTEEEAVTIANGTPYGLATSIWTRGIARAHRVAHRLESGIVWINDHHRIDPASPWGGFKMSGIVREHGFRSVQIGTTIEGEKLSSSRLRPILVKAQELGVYIQTHPYYIGDKAGLEDYYLTNLFGNPYETALMAADLMLSGTLDALPALKVGMVHGGGFLPYQIGRLVHGHAVREETRTHTSTSPLELMRRFYFDTLLFEPRAIALLVNLVGSEHVYLGTDAPFDMGDETPVSTVEAVPGLTSEQRAQILGGTALHLLGE